MFRPKAAVPSMITTIMVVPDEWHRLKQLALDQRTSVSALLRDVVHDLLVRHDRKARAGA
jgi:hypothetical protein